MRRVTLIETGIETTPLGFGTAALMGKLGERESLRLLDVAYDCGIRHFDTAPLYAFGDAELVLGKFLRKHADVTVATKYGLTSGGIRSTIIRGAKRILRPLLRGRPSLASATGAMVRNNVQARFHFDAATAENSLRTSLRRLRRDQVDLFLLHECRPSDVRAEGLLDFLQRSKQRGFIKQFGIATDISTIAYCVEAQPALTRVLQFANNLEQPNLSALKAITSKPACITHTPFGGMHNNAHKDNQSAALRYALEQNRHGIVLFSSQKPEHIISNVRLAEHLCV